MSDKRPIDRRKKGRWLDVEGDDDKWAVINLIARHGLDWGDPTQPLPHVEKADGVDRLLDQLAINLKTQTHYGIILDADYEEDGDAWARLRHRFSAAGLALPEAPDPDGTILIADQRRFGIWLMPDNVAQGMLEHFLEKLIPQDDSCLIHARQATTSARVDHGASFSPRHEQKALIHTWLAWQESPGRPFGTAITAHYFQHDTPAALKFVAWFNRLFIEP